jgi:hypothetical protein
VKTHPHLLVRDALAHAFVRACAGDPEAGTALAALGRRTRGEAPGGALAGLRAADGEALFDESGALAGRFAALEPYVRDRALRYEHALAWLAGATAPTDPLEGARAAWDAGLFFEVHEILEPVWMEATAARRDALQGLIMAGVALHHLCEGNPAGARGLLRDAARKLAAGAGSLPLDLASFARGLAELAADVEAGRVRGPADVRTLPRLTPR